MGDVWFETITFWYALTVETLLPKFGIQSKAVLTVNVKKKNPDRMTLNTFCNTEWFWKSTLVEGRMRVAPALSQQEDSKYSHPVIFHASCLMKCQIQISITMFLTALTLTAAKWRSATYREIFKYLSKIQHWGENTVALRNLKCFTATSAITPSNPINISTLAPPGE